MTTWFKLFALLCFFGAIVAQPSLPNGKYATTIEKSMPMDVPEHVLEAKDNEALKSARDADYSKSHDSPPALRAGPFIFAEHVPATIDIDTDGVWSDTEDDQGSPIRVWRMKIVAPTAVSLSVMCDKFYLPPGAEFYIQSDKRRLGAFTGELNNLPSGSFATMALPGTSILLEYFEPKGTAERVQLKIKSIIYGFDSTFSYVEPEKGMSGRCFMDIACDETKKYQPHHKSVVHMLLMDCQALCTGAMIATTDQKGEKLLLTAHHCGVDHDKFNSELNIVTFDFEAAECDAKEVSDADLFHTKALYGTEIVASYEPGDAMLMRVKDIKSMFHTLDVYFAGWTTDFQLNEEFHGIHHPSGDYKVISVVEGPLEKVAWDEGSLGIAAHLHVSRWKVGATEGGSSGSPLFTPKGYIVGQLHGGMSSCERRIHDFYGSLASSYKDLQPYLDPENTGTKTTNGYYLKDVVSTPEPVSDHVEPDHAQPEEEKSAEKVEAVVEEFKPNETVEEFKPNEKVEDVVEVKAAVEELKPVEKVEDAVEQIKEAVEESKPVEDIKEAVETVVTTVKESKPVEKVEAVVQDMKDVVEESKPVEEIKEAVEKAKDVVEEAKPIEEIKAVAQDIKEAVEESKPVEKVEDAVETVVTAVKESEPVEKVEAAVEKVEAAVEKAKDVVEEAKPVEEIKAVAQDIKEAVEESKPVEEIKEAVEEVKEAVEEKHSQPDAGDTVHSNPKPKQVADHKKEL